ncbi:MAG: hypothetical protein Q8R31_06110 [Candidatus Omnitrophota bacterium]|nr:hypothetical protein [Candidatus Omnitrophota bacterium]
MKIMIKAGLVVGLVLGVISIGFGQEAQEKSAEKIRRTSQMKEVQGEITWMSKSYIAIVFQRNDAGKSEEEILLPIDKETNLVHLRTLGDLARGDTVRVKYEEVVEEDAQGRRLNRLAKAISFVRKGNQKPIQAVTVEAPGKGSQILKTE